MSRRPKRLVTLLIIPAVIAGLLGVFVVSYRYELIETKTYAYEKTVSEIITLTKVETTQSVSFLYETTNSIQTTTLFQDNKIDRVEGGGVLGWGIGLGRLQPGDKVIAEISSVYKVLLCLDKPPEAEYGWLQRNFYYDCEYAYITDQGRYEMEIIKEGFYTLMVGKQSGYISTSFKLVVKVVRQQETIRTLTHTTTIVVTTTQPVVTTTTYRTTIVSTEIYTTKRGLLG